MQAGLAAQAVFARSFTFCDGDPGGAGEPAETTMALSGSASGGVGALGGDNFGLSGSAMADWRRYWWRRSRRKRML